MGEWKDVTRYLGGENPRLRDAWENRIAGCRVLLRARTLMRRPAWFVAIDNGGLEMLGHLDEFSEEEAKAKALGRLESHIEAALAAVREARRG